MIAIVDVQELSKMADSDGVCDANDQCPGLNDNLIGTACNDGDACTINDVYDSNCGCAGTYTDADGDGYCVGSDPDDFDGCNPDPNHVACNSCLILSSEGFESGWGIWADGGADARRSSSDASYANTGTYCIRLQDNTSTSTMTTSTMDMSGYDELTVGFSYYIRSFEGTEDFWLQISSNGGSTFTTVEDWIKGTDFNNDERHNPSVTIAGPFTSTTQFRFRADASGNSDWVYIDDVEIEGCVNPTGPSRQSNSNSVIQDSIDDLSPQIQTIEENIASSLTLFPNPTSELLTASFQLVQPASAVKLMITDYTGRVLLQVKLEEGSEQHQIDVSQFVSGYYFLHLISDTEKISKQFSIVR